MQEPNLALGLVLVMFPMLLCEGTGSCPTPVCPEGRQVVATCTVTDATGSFNTFWGGDSITSCPQDFIVLAHALDTSASGVCAGTTFRADIVSVEANNFSSHLSLIPTTSHNGQRIGCYSPTQSDLIQECTLDVLAVGVTGTVESDGLSGVFVNIALVEASGSACVDQYFTVFSGSRMNSSATRFGPFPMDLCSMPVVNGVTVGTSKNGVDGPTTVASAFTANTNDLYSNLEVSHTYDVSGVTLSLSWMAIDQTVMSQSEVNCSCMNTPVVSDSATSHSFRFSYNQSSPGQVDLSVSYQNGNCYDVERRVYEVANFGATTLLSLSELVTFTFDESLLADDVTVTRIRGRCEDGSLEMFWDYPLNAINLTVICTNSSYTFQALTSGNMPVGFPFTFPVVSSTAIVPVEPQRPPVIVAVVVVVVSVCGVLLTVLVSMGIVIGYRLKKREPHEVVYEDPDGEPSTGDNMAYGSVAGEKRLYSQPPTELREQMYEEPENFEPDPHTQGNVAYGQVQFTH